MLIILMIPSIHLQSLGRNLSNSSTGGLFRSKKDRNHEKGKGMTLYLLKSLSILIKDLGNRWPSRDLSLDTGVYPKAV